jgi:hypothetical protein
MSKTVTHYNGVVYIAADMQTPSNASGDKEYPVAIQHNTIVIKDAIHEERNLQHLVHQNNFADSDHVTFSITDIMNSYFRVSILEYVKEQSDFTVSSIQAPVIMGTKIQYNFRRALLPTVKRWK